MKIIGFHWDHNSSVALLEENQVIACVSEERFSRVKNDSRFPRHASDFCTVAAGGREKIDAVAVATIEKSYDWYLLNVFNNFKLADFIKEQHLYWKPRFYEDRRNEKLRDLFSQYIDRMQYPQDYWSVRGQDERREQSFPTDGDYLVARHFDIPIERVRRFDHHTCHARYALHASDFHDGPVLVLTVDGYGDGANCTIFLKQGDRLERQYSTVDCTLGRYYRFITLLLGMRPLEHEYKVMGLAPYGRGKDVERVLEILHRTLCIEGIRFVPGPNKPRDSYFSLRDLFEGIRFDHVAAGLQMWVEQLLEQWVGNVVKHFDVTTVVMGGGVAMNVKAMGRLAQMPWIRRFFVAGSTSDESNSIGAALCAAAEHGIAVGKAVTTLYLGTKAEADRTLVERARYDGHVVINNPTEIQLVKALLGGVVIGRCVGQMEFGQRALGNRSILADPIIPEIVSRINAMIKSRDFWMPFAPVILDAFVEEYLINPNGIDSPHMTIAFRTTEKGFRDLRAACHPADGTVRAQILRREQNPALYSILEEFRRQTGRGGLLNTSFNLHGYPIVNSVGEAYDVFSRTELDAVLIPEALILKASCQRNPVVASIITTA